MGKYIFFLLEGNEKNKFIFWEGNYIILNLEYLLINIVLVLEIIFLIF